MNIFSEKNYIDAENELTVRRGQGSGGGGLDWEFGIGM